VQASKTLGMPVASYAKWQLAASLINIPFDSELQVHPEYQGYPGE
jgi:hypothetical protein